MNADHIHENLNEHCSDLYCCKYGGNCRDVTLEEVRTLLTEKANVTVYYLNGSRYCMHAYFFHEELAKLDSPKYYTVRDTVTNQVFGVYELPSFFHAVFN